MEVCDFLLYYFLYFLGYTSLREVLAGWNNGNSMVTGFISLSCNSRISNQELRKKVLQQQLLVLLPCNNHTSLTEKQKQNNDDNKNMLWRYKGWYDIKVAGWSQEYRGGRNEQVDHGDILGSKSILHDTVTTDTCHLYICQNPQNLYPKKREP